MKKAISSILTIFLTLCAMAQSISSNGFYPPVVRKGQVAQYSVVLKDVEANIAAENIPAPAELQYVGSGTQTRMSITNMQTPVREKILTFNYIPTQDGEFEIKAWEISAGGKTYKIPAAVLKVSPNAPQNISTSPAYDPFEEMEEMMSNFGFSQFPSITRQRMRNSMPQETIDLQKETSAEIKFAAEKIYVGQAVPCQVSFKFSGKILNSDIKLRQLTPSIKNSDAFVCQGFLTEGKAVETKDPEFPVEFVFNTVVTPVKTGNFKIQFEANGVFTSAFGGFFSSNQNFTLTSKEQTVDVLELPKENMPNGFSGAIGEFKAEEATLDESSLSVGEPCVMDISISGTGNFDRISAPKLSASQNWKEYKPKTSFKDESNGYGFKGVKKFSYTLVPTAPDLKETPSAVFNYFNPNSQKYEELKIAPVAVSVAPSKSYAKRKAETAKTEKDAMQIIEETPSTLQSSSGILTSPYFWLAQCAALLAIGWIILKKIKQNKLEDDPVFARKTLAKSELKKDLAGAKSAAQKNNPKEFFEFGARALQNALSAASGLDAGAITKTDALSIMNNLDFSSKDKDFAAKIFDGADAIAFGGYTPEAEETNNLYSELEKLCQTLSQK